MNILQVHDENMYRGGEEIVCDLEYEILTEKGHSVRRFIVPPIQDFSLPEKFRLIRRFLYNRQMKRDIAREIRRFDPDLVHVHNYFPTITAAVFDACRESGVPGLLTLHNFRFMVPDGKLRRGEESGRSFLQLGFGQVFRRAYRDSFLYSLGVQLMILYNRIRRVWQNRVDAFIIPSAWMKDLFVRFGIEESRLYLKPHFVQDPFEGRSDAVPANREGYVYVGRLSQEKGILPLLRFWKEEAGGLPLTVIGTGPQEAEVWSLAEECENITCTGYLSRDQLQQALSGFKAMICTSRNHESFGLVVIEAFSAGTPVIAPDLFAYKELIEVEKTGFLFDPDRLGGIKSYLDELEKDPGLVRRMSQNARDSYEMNYTPDIHYRRYMEIVGKIVMSLES